MEIITTIVFTEMVTWGGGYLIGKITSNSSVSFFAVNKK